MPTWRLLQLLGIGKYSDPTPLRSIVRRQTLKSTMFQRDFAWSFDGTLIATSNSFTGIDVWNVREGK